MKKLILFVAALFTIILTVILFYGIMSYMMSSNYQTESKFIEVRKFETIQGDYVEISIEEVKAYPKLERIILGEGCINFDNNNWRCDVTDKEYNKLLDLIQIDKKVKVDSFFRIGENYYGFGFGSP